MRFAREKRLNDLAIACMAEPEHAEPGRTKIVLALLDAVLKEPSFATIEVLDSLEDLKEIPLAIPPGPDIRVASRSSVLVIDGLPISFWTRYAYSAGGADPVECWEPGEEESEPREGTRAILEKLGLRDALPDPRVLGANHKPSAEATRQIEVAIEYSYLIERFLEENPDIRLG